MKKQFTIWLGPCEKLTKKNLLGDKIGFEKIPCNRQDVIECKRWYWEDVKKLQLPAKKQCETCKPVKYRVTVERV